MKPFLSSWLFLACMAQGASAQSRMQDSLTLVDLYNATNGANWTNKTNWLSLNPMNTWYGITLNAQGRVNCLDLDGAVDCSTYDANLGNNLSGQLPNSIGNLDQLQFLSLERNRLGVNNGKIPVTLGNLTNLQYLSLAQNWFSDTIPSRFGNLTQLKTLSLLINNLTGNIPTTFGNLTNLEKLLLYNNQLTGTIPNTLGGLTHLKEIQLYDNRLTGAIPTELGNLQTLQKLNISSNQLSGCFPSTLNRFCALVFPQGLDFSNNPALPWSGNFQRFCNGEAQIGAPCDDNNPNTIGDTIRANCSCAGRDTAVPMACRTRDSLVLVGLYNATNGLQWTNRWILTQPITTWYGIRTNTQGCVTGIDLDGNPNHSSLVGFGNNLGGALPNLDSLTNLTSLYLSNNKLSGTIPNFNLPNLTELNLNKNLFTGGIPNFNLPNLTALAITTNHLLTGNIPNFNLPKLLYLWLYDNRLTGSIPNFNFLPNLRLLNLYANQLTGNIPPFNLRYLTELELGINQLIGTIPELTLPNLQHLGLKNNQLTGSIPNFTLPSLLVIYLNNNQLSGAIPNFNLPLLRTLLLFENQLTGSIPNFNLPALEYLWLYNNRLTGSIPLFNVPRLLQFDVSNNQLTGRLPLLNCPNLELIRCQFNFLDSMPNLSSLRLKPDSASFLKGLRSFNNKLTFSHLLPNLGFRTTATFIYAPQDSIFKDTIFTRSRGQSLTIDLGIDAGIADNQYEWFKNGVAYQTITGNNQLIFNYLQPTHEGIYTCKITNWRAPLLTLYSRKITIRVNCLLFNAPVAIAGNATYCIGNPNPLTATAGFARYLWSTGDTTRTIAPIGTQQYRVTVTNLAGCDTTVTMQVTAYPLPNFNIVGNLFLCEGKFTELNIANNYPQYQWSSGERTNKIKITLAGNYTVTVTSAEGCTSLKTVAIPEQKVVRMPARYDSICKGSTYTFPSGRTTQIGGIFQDTVRWKTSFCDSTITPIHLLVKTPVPERIQRFVCDTLLEKIETVPAVQMGCPTTQIRESIFDMETCFDRLNFHNGLIINQNQQNETFHISSIERLQPNRLVIQDQRGMEVFKTENYKNGWRGTDNQGNPLPKGAYEFWFEVMDLKKNKTYTRVGTIHIAY